ncbi:MAG: 1-acyl-sn-glycerol-3-phosphate acyltransferase, partial [Anaeromyxobacteraceae bacterium]
MANERDAVTGDSAGRAAERDVLVRRVGAAIDGLVRAGYFSIDVEGAEHVPRTGPVLYAQNHAGWFALDTIILGGAVARAVGLERTPYFAAHERHLHERPAPLAHPVGAPERLRVAAHALGADAVGLDLRRQPLRVPERGCGEAAEAL